VEDAGVSLPAVSEFSPGNGEETEDLNMPSYDPTLATLVGIAACGYVGMIGMRVIIFWDWGKGKRRRGL
jgi:hypothetical protein